MSFLILPTDEEYRKCYPKIHRAPNIPDGILQQLGYDPDEVKEIKKVLENG